MRFLGVDFGWTRQPSGVASLTFEGGALSLVAMARVAAAEDVPAWVEGQLGTGPGMVAIDAPTIIRNPSGMRPCEREMHRAFGHAHAGCYPSNLGSVFAARTLALSRALEAAGFAHADRMEARRPGRYQIEVFPHAASLHLLSLMRILRYKKGRLAERRAGLAQFQDLLIEKLAAHEPRLQPFNPGEVPSGGAALKAHEDQLDAILCAYIGAWWWYWGTKRTRVFGDTETGFLVVPVSTEHAAAAQADGLSSTGGNPRSAIKFAQPS